MQNKKIERDKSFLPINFVLWIEASSPLGLGASIVDGNVVANANLIVIH